MPQPDNNTLANDTNDFIKQELCWFNFRPTPQEFLCTNKPKTTSIIGSASYYAQCMWPNEQP